MGGQIPAGLHQVESKQDAFHAAATYEKRGDYGTLILDRLGRILSCGTHVEQMFGASQIRLIGKLVSYFASGQLPSGSSPSFNARYLGHLCADGEWRKYEVRDGKGGAFVVELNLARVVTARADQEMFLLNVHRCGSPDEPVANGGGKAMRPVYLSGDAKYAGNDHPAIDRNAQLEGVVRLGQEWLKRTAPPDPKRGNHVPHDRAGRRLDPGR